MQAGELTADDVVAVLSRPSLGSSDRSIAEFALAGYYVGDGSCGPTSRGTSIGAGFTNADQAVLADFRALADELGWPYRMQKKRPAHPDRAPGPAETWHLRGGVRDWLREVGLGGQTSHTKRVPRFVYEGDEEQIGAFLGAYFACDASVSDRQGRAGDGNWSVEFTSINEPLLRDCITLLARLGVPCRLRSKQGTYNGRAVESWRLWIPGREAQARFITRARVIGEKHDKLNALQVRTFDPPYLADPVVEVVPIEERECRCLTVDEDASFVADGIVVHNSEIGSRRGPVWYLDRFPDRRIIGASYAGELAVSNGRYVRNMIEQHADKLRVRLSADSQAAHRWNTPQGGGMLTAGVGGSITGFGANLFVIDDPFKDWAAALSEKVRDSVWDWFASVARLRLEPDASMIVISTRWHVDDLHGRLEESGEKWEIVRLPAFAEENDPLGRAIGEPLVPERYDGAALNEIRVAIGDWMFDAMFQQSPRRLSGGMFPPDKWKIEHHLPPGLDLQLVRRWDLAGTEDDGDYTAGVLLGRDTRTGVCYVLDVRREQVDDLGVKKLLTHTAALDKARWDHDHRRHRIRIEQEPGSGGKSWAKTLVRELSGYLASAEGSTGAKEVRAAPFAAQQQAENVVIIRPDGYYPTSKAAPDGNWVPAFVAEHGEFPRGKNDDQVDAASLAFTDLTLGSAPAEVKSMAGRRLPG
ncbi:MAG: LAGLIDADG family homing endonuclease [Actinomycetota bacterium]